MADTRSDADLFAALRAGDVRAFEALFLRYHPSLCSFASRYVDDDAIAEELVQEALLFVWQRRASLELTGDALPRYLFTSVRNAAVSHLRHRHIERRSVPDILALTTAPARADREVETSELAAAVRRAVTQLPERCRAVFALHRDQGMSYNDIAQTLGISPKTVEVHMGKAFKLLRRSLARFRAPE